MMATVTEVHVSYEVFERLESTYGIEGTQALYGAVLIPDEYVCGHETWLRY